MATSTTYDLATCSGCCIAPPSGCCGSGTPTTLTATFSSASGACTCLAGATKSIVWNGTAWIGVTTPGTCGHQFSLSLACVSGVYQLTLSFPDSCHVPLTPGPVSASCTPFSLTYNFPAFGVVCGCTLSVMAPSFTITITP